MKPQRDQVQLIADVRSLHQEIKTLPQRNQYEDLQINGSFSFIKFAEHVIKRVQKGPSSESMQVLSLIHNLSQLLLESARGDGVESDILTWTKLQQFMTSENYALLIRGIGFSQFRTKDQGLMHMMVLCLHNGGHSQTLRHFMVPSSSRKTRGHIHDSGTEGFFIKAKEALDLTYPPADLFYNTFHSVKKKNVLIPRINECEIYLDSNKRTQLRKNPTIKNQSFKLTARLFREKHKSSPQNSIIFHMQGGAFHTLIPSAVEPVMRFMTKVLKIPTITVDYRTCPEDRYPSFVQDCLDTYCFLASGTQEVKDMIGFIPEKIILTGDSAGGFLCHSVVKVISMMQAETGMAPPMMPTCMQLVYPAFLPDSWGIDSMIFSMVDPVLPFGPLMSVGPASFNLDGFKDCWFKDPKEIARFFNSFTETVVRDPYRCFAYDGGLDFMDDIKCSVICGEYDPLLDASVSLAKFHPKSSFHALDIAFKSTHGFPSSEISVHSHKYVELIPFRIAQMMGIPMDQLKPSLVKRCTSLIEKQRVQLSRVKESNNN